MRERRPARRVLRIALEAGAQVGVELRDDRLRRLERDREGLACDVVGCAAEAAGDEQMIDARRFPADEIDDLLGLVRHRRGDCDLDAELFEPLRKPGAVRVHGVAGDELVADCQDGCTHMASMTIRKIDLERDGEYKVCRCRMLRHFRAAGLAVVRCRSARYPSPPSTSFWPGLVLVRGRGAGGRLVG